MKVIRQHHHGVNLKPMYITYCRKRATQQCDVIGQQLVSAIK